MTTKELLRSLSDLNAEQILEAEAYAARSPRPWARWMATAACVAVMAAASWQLALRPAETPPPADRGEAETAETDGAAARPDDGAVLSDDGETPAAPEQAASETLGGVAIGMSPSEVTAVLGDGSRVSEPVEWPEYGYRYQVWSYPELRVRLVDTGDGWSVGELMTTEGSAAALSSGIGLDASREEITAAYPDAEISEQDGVWSAYVPYADCALWIVHAPDGGAYIRLAARTPDPEPVGNTLSAETIRVVAADGTEVTLVDKAAKRVGTVLTIMEPEPAENPGEAPGWWLDFGNGTYLAVYGYDDLATVYTGDALDPAAMTEQLTGIYLDLDTTLAGALENPTETWE